MKTLTKAILALLLSFTSLSSKAQDITQTGHECLGILTTIEIYLSEIPSDVYYVVYDIPSPSDPFGSWQGNPTSYPQAYGPGSPVLIYNGADLKLQLTVRQLKMYALGTGTSIADIDIPVVAQEDPLTHIIYWYYTVKLILHE